MHLLREFSRSTAGSLFFEMNLSSYGPQRGKGKIGGQDAVASNASEPDPIDPIIRIRVGDQSKGIFVSSESISLHSPKSK